MKNYSLILYLLFIVNSCQQKDISSTDFIITNEFIFHLEDSGLFFVPFWQITPLPDGDRYSYFHLYDNALKIFDLESQNLLHELIFPEEGPNGVDNVIGYYLDEYFVIFVTSNELVKTNYSGEVLERFSNDSISQKIGKEVTMMVNSNFRFETYSYDLANSRLFIVVDSDGRYFDEVPGMIEVDFSTSEIEFISLEMPDHHDLLRPLSSDLLVRDYYYPYLTVSPPYLTYNYAGQSDFYRLDLSDVEQSPEKISPKFNFTPKLKFEGFNQGNGIGQKIENFVHGNYHFGPVKFDRQNKVYYQICINPVKLDPSNGDIIQNARLFAIDQNNYNIYAIEYIEEEQEGSISFLRGWSVYKGGVLTKDKPKEEESVPYFQYRMRIKG